MVAEISHFYWREVFIEHPVYPFRWIFYNDKGVLIFMLFFLTLSRFLTIQAPDIYDKIFSKKIIIPNIIAYNLLIHTLHSVFGFIDYLTHDIGILTLVDSKYNDKV